jgi:hypothetical protein
MPAKDKLISKQRVYVTKDRTKAVPAGHPEAAFLLVPEGGEIHEKRVEEIEGATSLMAKEAPKQLATAKKPKRREGVQFARSTATIKAKKRAAAKGESKNEGDSEKADKPKTANLTEKLEETIKAAAPTTKKSTKKKKK